MSPDRSRSQRTRREPTRDDVGAMHERTPFGRSLAFIVRPKVHNVEWIGNTSPRICLSLPFRLAVRALCVK